MQPDTTLAMPLHSALYIGHVQHRRLRPLQHQFRYRLFMLYLDLAELDQVFHKRWLWSTRRAALARFDRRDHFGDPAVPLDQSVRALVERETGHRPTGPIRLLTHLRYFAYCFNPISIYYCFDRHNDLTALVAEVSNTPWGERHCYVMASSQADRDHHYHLSKTLPVSPFMPMALDYDWRCNVPSRTLAVHMNVLQNQEKLFDATLALRRKTITTWSLAQALLQFPWMSAKVILAIYWEALRLWLKRLPIYDHIPFTDTSENDRL